MPCYLRVCLNLLLKLLERYFLSEGVRQAEQLITKLTDARKNLKNMNEEQIPLYLKMFQ